MATLSSLTATTVLTAGDYFYVLDGPNSRKIDWAEVLNQIEAQGAAPASFISSGTFADARIAASNVTQHQAALSITESQISDLGTYQVQLAEGAFINGDKTKLDGIEALADVTDTANVTAAGALMDSELASETHVKALDQSVISGASPTFSTANMTDAANKRFMTDAQEAKLDGVEANADVTDATNVAAAGGVLSDPSGVTGADQITNMMSLTQAEYDAITPNASTFYVIVG